MKASHLAAMAELEAQRQKVQAQQTARGWRQPKQPSDALAWWYLGMIVVGLFVVFCAR